MRLLLVALSLLVCAFADATPQEIRPYDPGDIVRLEGDAETIGRAHGEALGAEVRTLLQGWLLPKLRQVPLLAEVYASIKARQMEAHVPAELVAEMKATARAAGVDYRHLLIANAVPDIMELVRRPFACSTFVAMPERSATGGLILGRNLDYGDSEILRAHWRPTVFARTGKLKVLSINVPGLSGLLTAINEKGVSMSRMTSYSKDMTAHGVPTMLLYRMVLEQAESAEEAAALYLAHANTVAINTMITDRTTALVLESTATKHAIRRPSEHLTLYSANHFETAALVDSEHGRDERWPVLAAHDGTRDPLDVADVTATIAGAGRPTGNILAVMIDYAGDRLLFGSDPERRQNAASGPLWELRLSDAFGR